MYKKTINSVTGKNVVTYICDNCVKEMPGSAIMVYYPYGHPCDSIDGPSHFCSDKCVIEWQKKEIKKFGEWKSKTEKRDSKVRSSSEWRREKNSPKAPGAARKTSRRNNSARKDDQKAESEE